MRFADVKNDVAFRKIFGNENRTECLISFLNAILGFKGADRIKSVTILNPYQLPKLRGGKVSILDVRATDQREQQFIVEMQVAEQDGFDKRVLYYLTKGYTSQIRHAEEYRKLKPAFFIGILSDFSHTQNPHYLSRSRIQDIDTGEVTIKDVEFNLIELQKFNKTLEEAQSLTDKWIYFIKNAEDLEVMPPNLRDKGLLAAYEEANQWTWTQEELDAYDYVGMREEDERAKLDFAIRKGMKEGIKEGMKEGIKEGMKEGIKEGMKEGMKEGRNKIVIQPYLKGKTPEQISEFLEIPIEEVMQIVAEFEEKNAKNS